MSHFVVDVEADGPIPGIYSMVSFGVILVDKDELFNHFYGEVKPISQNWNPESLAISKFSRDQHLNFPEPQKVMIEFNEWIKKNNTNGRPIFWSDNLAFDWQWINYYSHKFLNYNPFGHSGRRISDVICGYEKDLRFSWKKLKKTKHTHHPVDDAKGNAEVLSLYLKKFKEI